MTTTTCLPIQTIYANVLKAREEYAKQKGVPVAYVGQRYKKGGICFYVRKSPAK